MSKMFRRSTMFDASSMSAVLQHWMTLLAEVMPRRLYSSPPLRICHSRFCSRSRCAGGMNEPARPALGTNRMSISLLRGSAGSRASRTRLAPFSR